MRTGLPAIVAFSSMLILGASCSGLPHVVLPSDPLTASEHVQLGSILEEKGLLDDARREYQAALSRKADHPGALIGLGNLSFNERNYPKAEEYYARALNAAPGHPSAANNLALVYLEEGRNLPEAERLAVQALAHAGALRPHILHTLAAIYIRQERYQEAKTCLDEATLLAPASQVALHKEISKAMALLP